jgi:hypothetical protein
MLGRIRIGFSTERAPDLEAATVSLPGGGVREVWGAVAATEPGDCVSRLACRE